MSCSNRLKECDLLPHTYFGSKINYDIKLSKIAL